MFVSYSPAKARLVLALILICGLELANDLAPAETKAMTTFSMECLKDGNTKGDTIYFSYDHDGTFRDSDFHKIESVSISMSEMQNCVQTLLKRGAYIRVRFVTSSDFK